MWNGYLIAICVHMHRIMHVPANKWLVVRIAYMPTKAEFFDRTLLICVTRANSTKMLRLPTGWTNSQCGGTAAFVVEQF